MRLLLKNCSILTGRDGDYAVIEDGFLGVDGSVIDYVGEKAPVAAYDEQKDMDGCLLIPGLVNCHCHAAMTLVRGVGSDLPLQTWLFDKIMPIEANMTEDDISAGTRLAMLELLACGTTSFTDMYDFPWRVASDVDAAGMKVNLSRPLVCFDPELSGEDCSRIDESIAFYREYDGMADGRVHVDLAMHSEYLTTENTVRRYAKLAESTAARMHVHISETKSEHEECKARHGITPMAYFLKMGILKTPTYAAHCVWCEDEDLAIMKEHGVTLVHNPSSNMKLGSGFAPVPRALELGVNVALGTDGVASNNNLNMFEEMHLASIIHNGYTCDPVVVNPKQVLAMATSNGARAQGRQDTGEISTGKKADIAAISLKAPHMYPMVDTVPMLTYSAQGSDVVMTMVDGKILYENGEYKTIDREKTMYDMEKAVQRLFHS